MGINLPNDPKMLKKESKHYYFIFKIIVNKDYFEFLHIIGRGGFGSVWKVKLKSTNDYFAAKIMSKSKIITKRSEDSIMGERRILSKIHHPFIVNMYFSFQDYDNLYLIMDLLSGGDLRYHLSHKKPQTFNEIQTKFFISNIIIALEYIHSQKIIHRDIKPENLVLDINGYARLTDFGIAIVNKKESSKESSGTAGYMAPEVMLLQGHSYPADFFALGVIGYEFMFGHRPYSGKNRKQIKEFILAYQAKIKFKHVKKGWSENSRDFINRLLQRRPVKRLGYGGIKELKEHSWMKDINWELLKKKKFKAPYIPKHGNEYFDKKYCEEKTYEKYKDLMNLDGYQNVFINYTFINLNYISKFLNTKNNNPINNNNASNDNNMKQLSFSESLAMIRGNSFPISKYAKDISILKKNDKKYYSSRKICSSDKKTRNKAKKNLSASHDKEKEKIYKSAKRLKRVHSFFKDRKHKNEKMSKCFSSENILLKENEHLNLEEFHRLIIEKSGIKNSPIFNFNNYFNISIRGFSCNSTKKSNNKENKAFNYNHCKNIKSIIPKSKSNKNIKKNENINNDIKEINEKSILIKKENIKEKSMDNKKEKEKEIKDHSNLSFKEKEKIINPKENNEIKSSKDNKNSKEIKEIKDNKEIKDYKGKNIIKKINKKIKLNNNHINNNKGKIMKKEKLKYITNDNKNFNNNKSKESFFHNQYSTNKNNNYNIYSRNNLKVKAKEKNVKSKTNNISKSNRIKDKNNSKDTDFKIKVVHKTVYKILHNFNRKKENRITSDLTVSKNNSANKNTVHKNKLLKTSKKVLSLRKNDKKILAHKSNKMFNSQGFEEFRKKKIKNLEEKKMYKSLSTENVINK